MGNRGIHKAWNVNESTPSETLGVCRWFNNGTNGEWQLKYVQYHASATAAGAANTVVYYSDSDGAVVTDDQSASETGNINDVAGVLLAALTAGNYGWMLVNGKHTVATNGDDDIAAAAALIGGGDGTCNSVAANTAPTNKVLGWALAADDDDADTVSAYITVGP